jgi:hypothetical protein
MFMLKDQNNLSILQTYSFCFMLGLSSAVCDITSLKARNKISPSEQYQQQ